MGESSRVVWAPIARSDLDGIVDYITERDGAERAEGVARRLLARVSALAAHPRLGRVVPELRSIGIMDYREFLSPPYRVLYRVLKPGARILGVLDARRDLEALILARALAEQ